MYARRFPITTTVLILNSVMFLGILAGIVPRTWTLSIPQVFDAGTWLAHLSHYDFLHLLMNLAIFSQIGPLVEVRMPRKDFVSFLLVLWAFTGISVSLLSQHPSLGFSGIVMGVLAFTIGLYAHVKPLARQLGFWLLINIMIGLMPMVSFAGHAGGAVVGGLLWLLYRKRA